MQVPPSELCGNAIIFQVQVLFCSEVSFSTAIKQCYDGEIVQTK